MKKFVFSLEKVLGLKEQLLDVAMNELAALQAQLLQIERDIEEVEQVFTEKNEAMRQELSKGAAPQEIMAYKVYFNVLNAKGRALAASHARVEQEITAKQQEIILLKSEISGYEKLREKQRFEYDTLARKAEELSIEEFVSKEYSYAGR